MINLDVNTRTGVVNARRLILAGCVLFHAAWAFSLYCIFS